jgi:hypothetical protein
MATDRNCGKPCKDCGKVKGQNQRCDLRCYRCGLDFKKRGRKQSHARRVVQVYGITGEEYEKLYAAQGSACAICLRATGRSKRLAVDHDHAIEQVHGNRASVRGLLCSVCNNFLGHARDDPEFFKRAITYLLDPPARKVLDL